MRTKQTRYPVMIERRTGRIVPPQPGVSSLLPIEESDNPLRNVAPSETIWRYMDFWKFEDFLSKSALYFARADKLEDPFEGKLSAGNANGWSKSDQAFYSAYDITQTHEDINAGLDTQRGCVFLSCWHRNSKESRKMWNAYTKTSESVVLTSSVKAVTRFIPVTIMKSPVKYHSGGYPRSLLFGWLGIYFYKLKPYSFEREFRLLRSLSEGESVLKDNKADFGRLVSCEPAKIVHRVITHPYASAAFKRTVEDLMRKYLKAKGREDSCLLK